jgi:biotin carboxyl carrier protein
MSKNLQVKVNGKPYSVDVDDFSGNVMNLSVDGHCFTVEFEDTGSAVIMPSAKTVQTTTTTAAPAKASTPVAVVSSSGASTDVIIAPMPGVILDISVKPGDKVSPEQPICALEAMKMKNIIRSNRDGIIACVEVSEGQRVPYGAVIIRFA